MKKNLLKRSSLKILFNKRGGLSVFLFIGGFLGTFCYEWAQEKDFPPLIHEVSSLRIKACFTPQQRCQPRLVKAVDQAQKEILVMCYAFTAPSLAEALLRAHKRGVVVKIIADKSQLREPASQISRLQALGIPVAIDRTVAIAHNKVMIIDEILTLTGSYNFSQAAEYKNAENLLFIESIELAEQYKRNWMTRYEKATPFSLISSQSQTISSQKKHKR